MANESQVTKRLATEEGQQQQTYALTRIAGKLGALDGITSWGTFQALVRAGLIGLYIQPGSQVVAEKESGIYVSVSGDGITAAAVDEDAFLAATGTAGNGVWEYTYDGTAWHMDGVGVVELNAYGITVTGTPANGDAIAVHEVASEVVFDVAGIDYDIPVPSAYTHSVTLITHDLQTYGTIPMCPAQLLYYASEALPAVESISLTLDHGAYNGGTTQDGTYQFTPTQTIPVGGGFRHTAIGYYQSNGYTKDQILAGTFTTYDADGNVLESGLVTTEGTGTHDVGTTSASTATYKTSDDLNFTQRNYAGSNNTASSVHRLWATSSAKGAASGAVASWWKRLTKFDLPVRSTLPGWLHGFDPSFVAAIGPVRKRTALATCDGGGYVDTTETVFDVSMTEYGFGANNGQYETAVDANGNALTTGYPIFTDNASRIKTYGGTARNYFHRGPYPSLADVVRRSHPDGSLNHNFASSTYGAAFGLSIF